MPDPSRPATGAHDPHPALGRDGGQPPRAAVRAAPGAAPGTRSKPHRPLRRARAAPLLALLLLVALAGWVLFGLLASGGASDDRPVRVEIAKGSGVGEIAGILDERGVVSSALWFEVRTTVAGHRGDLKAGTYSLPAGAGHDEVVRALSAGPDPLKPRVVRVTIPEGRSRREIAPVVADAGLRGSYATASRRSRALDPERYGAEGPRDLEGFLFPSTYEVRSGASARTLVRKQLEAFEREWGTVSLRAARRRNLTPYEVLIVASMVEREAQVAEERPIIASVIYNRLREGTPLGIDATVRYAVRNWTKPLTQSELAVASPYNTRTRAGLPPGPIGNPGIASIKAAAAPARTRFRYYVVKPGACGEHVFSETLAEFTEDSNRYNEARARAGGRSPTTC
jgi:uncharacterized YceG family protein